MQKRRLLVTSRLFISAFRNEHRRHGEHVVVGVAADREQREGVVLAELAKELRGDNVLPLQRKAVAGAA
jgi:hypothetical protein